MILSRVEITNYKQYGGHHAIDIPQSGAIGVIGANGVGKTTLFEAIEWALYSPSGIKSADVKPRVWRGKTEVKVTIDDPGTGGRFLVERELGKGSAKARIYRVDQNGFEEKIVDGAAQVTGYVTQNLIGLDHSAFVATFFTRQKELGFFNGSPTTRRRDVGKLLGLETIREAQQLIAEDRKKAQADARSYQAQSEAQSKDRDFAAEIAAAQESIERAKTSVQEMVAAVDAAKARSAQAEKSLTAFDHIREQDGAIAQRLLQKQREHDVSREQAGNASRELERLANLASERERQQPIAATRVALHEEEQAQAATRQSALRKRELEQLLKSFAERDNDAATSIRDAIRSSPAPDGATDWNMATPAAAIDWAATINISALEQQAAGIAAAIDLNEQLNAETNRLTAYNQKIEQYQRHQQTLLEPGDPAVRLQEIQTHLQELNGSVSAAHASASRIREDLAKTEQVLANLRQQQEGEICPTCQRPFTSDDTVHAITIFERTVETHRQQLQQIDSLLASNRTSIAKAQTQQAEQNEAIKKLTEIRASIESGKRYVQEQQAKVDECQARLQQNLNTLGMAQTPSVQQRDDRQRALIAWRKVVDAAANVERAMRARTQIANDRQPVEQELASLVDISYDEHHHREVTERLQAARQAQANIERIDGELARRDEITSVRDSAVAIVRDAVQHLAILQQERTALGFDPAAHQQAQIAMRTAQEQERAATEQRHRSEVAFHDTEHALKTITNEQDRIGRLAIEAEAKQREADDLDTMYKEFTEFERYAAAWYAPRLSEIASDLVSQVTDGKYDRVEFDNNFSIQVFDGDDEKFPYETFSGGERDAIALCARIALSRVIGGASSSPPGFLVLDEVFGSLDLERRQRLLEMLAAITGADDHFRQIFIISHVDDVRTSPILDDIWRVVETEDGTSELQTLGVGVDIGEL